MILVTGGCGYIGSHVITRLLEKKYKVISVDNFSNSSSTINNKIKKLSKNNFEFIQGDIRSRSTLNKIFSTYDIKIVMHFAGLKSISYSFGDPISYYSNNFSGSLNLINIMKEFKVKKIIFSSSATVYGGTYEPPFTEDMKLIIPESPYAQTKLMVEELLKKIVLQHPEWRVGILRYFNPVAFDSRIFLNSFNKSDTNLLPKILSVINQRKNYLEIYGNKFNTRDGTGVRDYIHINDLVNGHLEALNNINKKKGLKIWNLGSGKGYSVLEVINMFESILNIKIPVKFVKPRKGDLPEYWADVSKAKSELGWEPQKDLADMVNDSIYK